MTVLTNQKVICLKPKNATAQFQTVMTNVVNQIALLNVNVQKSLDLETITSRALDLVMVQDQVVTSVVSPDVSQLKKNPSLLQ